LKEFSKEIINIGGVDYTLFLNRKGIVAWENITKAARKKSDLEATVDKLQKEEEIVIKDGDNPFEISHADEILSAENETQDYYAKLYWIMLYEEHKLDYSEVQKLFNQAVEEYGIDALAELAVQMLEDANINRSENNELKKLTALRPKK
jgi:hypothetical protein